MRFRFWLPTLQVFAMLLILWAPWAAKAHELHVVLTDGTDFKTWILIPGPHALEWAEGMNLPASAVVTPVEFAIRKTGAPPNYKMRFYSLSLLGLLCWYMVGRFLDDLLRWRRSRQLPKKDSVDVIFALLAVPSSVLLASVFVFGGADTQVLAWWGVIWVAASCSALAFRLLPLMRQRRKPSVS